MKRILLSVLLITVLSVLSACGSDPAVTTASPTAEPTTAETTFLTGPISEKDLLFSKGGKDFALLSDVQAILTALGEGYKLEAAPSCMFVGEDKHFIYENGYDLFTYPIDGMDQVDEIMITDTSYITARGISVGDSYDEVVSAYGDGNFDDVILTYVVSGEDPMTAPRLFFEIKDGKVSYISYYSARNMR
ncbi:MAG: hypothetical protein GX099_08065 [Clostridiaceae bacterium]|nr:hypothetical protein [Oscillospiraceae bacterium]NLO63363.1 hypothetical protein [Clostridiaceae bacterium]